LPRPDSPAVATEVDVDAVAEMPVDDEPVVEELVLYQSLGFPPGAVDALPPRVIIG
jgi:hypothetical protein